MKILKGDQVKMLIGKDKGRTGQVIACFPKKGKILVKGLNIFKKHLKASQNQSGGIVEKEASVYVSKLALICPNCQKTTRVAYKIDKSGQKYRLCKKCNSLINSTSAKT
jgi:large subunit ribosomal protein L24